jgi:putative DNA primase/helicase
MASAGACACREAEKCSKSPGKHPRIDRWPEIATTDPTTIREWWEVWPSANLAVATGAKPGVVVVDVDVGPQKPGDLSIDMLQKEFGSAPKTFAARTGSGGLHLFFRHPGTHVPNGGNVLPGIDVRADGGYVIAAPSSPSRAASYWRQARLFPSDRPRRCRRTGPYGS